MKIENRIGKHSRQLALTACCVLCLFATSQTVWNRTYVGDRPTMLFSSVIKTGSGYCVSGVTTGVPNNTAKGMIGCIDSTGLLTSFLTLGDSVNANYGVFWNNLMLTKDGKLAFAGYCYDSLPSILLAFTKATDSIDYFRYHFPQSSGFQAYSLIQYNDSTYFISGGRTDSISNNVDAVLLKVSNQGQLLWQKKYNQYLFDYAGKVVELANGNLMLGGVRNNLSQSNQKANTWLLEVDTGGSFVRQWFDPNDSTYAAEGLLQTQDGGFIYGAQKKFSESGGLVAYTNTIVKMNSNFNKQWTYNGGYRSIYTGISDIEELADGSFVACGQYPIYGTDTALWGCVVKLAANGNVIWERTFRGINTSQTLNFLSDIDVLPDGSLIAVGQCQLSGATPPQVGWFLKLDSNGCEVENCLVGIDDIERNEVLILSPNPASNVFYVTLNADMLGATIRIFDAVGKLLLSQQATEDKTPLDVSAVSKGLYFVTVQKNETVLSRKLIIE